MECNLLLEYGALPQTFLIFRFSFLLIEISSTNHYPVHAGLKEAS